MRHQTRTTNDFTRADPDRDRLSGTATHPALTATPMPPAVSSPVFETHPGLEPSRTEDAIRTRAYLMWEAAGRPAGDGVNFWLEAERELRGQ